MNLIFIFTVCVTYNLDISQRPGNVLINFEIMMLEGEKLNEIQFCYSPEREKWFTIAYYHYENPIVDEKTSFSWIFPASCWHDGWIKVIVGNILTQIGESVTLKMPCLKDSSLNIEQHNYTSNYFYQSENSSWWPMFRYDAQHTAAYPHSLNHPLALEWTRVISYNDFVMLSGAVGNELLFVGDGLNRIMALSINSGDVVWEKTLTSNVWAAMLMDTLLFVGTSFEPTLTQPTFFCLDARTGEIKWSDFFWTVEFSPVFIDSFVVAASFTRVRNYLYNGSLIWENILCDTMSVLYNSPTVHGQKVFVGGKNSLVQAIDLLSGNIIWEHSTSNWVTSPITATDSLLFFYTWDNLVCLRNGDGSEKWQRNIFPKGLRSGIAGDDGLIYCASLGQQGADRFTRAACYVGENGQEKWNVEFNASQGSGSSGGVTTIDNLFWLNNTAQIFALNIDNGVVKYNEDYLSTYGGFGCWAWPIIQKGKFLTAKGSRLFCFQNISQTSPEADVTCWPIPFSSNCNISFSSEYPGIIKLECFDILGRLVKCIEEKESLPGIFLFHWDGTSENGEIVPSGIYFISYEISLYKPGVRKVIFLKERRNQ